MPSRCGTSISHSRLSPIIQVSGAVTPSACMACRKARSIPNYGDSAFNLTWAKPLGAESR
jgi:hypothetical protein